MECLNSHKRLERHSPSEQSTLDSTIEKGAEKLVDKKNSYIDPWTRLVGRANEEQIVINGHPVTALLDTGSQVTHVSRAFCQAKGLHINPLNQLVEIEGTGGNSVKYVGYIEANSILHLGSHTFEVEALLLVLPSTDYQKRVPVAIGNTMTDMVVDFINQNNPDEISKSWKAVFMLTYFILMWPYHEHETSYGISMNRIHLWISRKSDSTLSRSR